MRRELALSGVARQAERPVRCIACLAFVGVMGVAFLADMGLPAASDQGFHRLGSITHGDVRRPATRGRGVLQLRPTPRWRGRC